MASKFQETNRFVVDEFLDTFGREFCKHEVLWKPQPYCKDLEIQSATHAAYRMLAQALSLSLEAVLEFLEAFPAACLNLISHYELRRRIDASCRMPDWLTLLSGYFRVDNKSMKYNKTGVFARLELVRALCESARVGLGGGPARGSAEGSAADTEDGACPLRGSQAVAYFVARHGVGEEAVLPAWRGVLELSVLKLQALAAAGDRAGLLPAALRPAAAERWLADLALLHDAGPSQLTDLTPAKLRMLVLLFQLIVAAKGAVRGEVRSAGGAPTPERSSDDEPHAKSDPEPVTLATSGDTSDGDICDKYSEERSKYNMEVPVLRDEGRVDEPRSDVMEKTHVGYRERESFISSKTDTRSEHPTRYRYEESESKASEKSKAVWALVYTELMKRGRSASLVSLQHRWVELLQMARAALLEAWARGAPPHARGAPPQARVHPLLLLVAHRIPKIVTEGLPSWKRLVAERRVVLESDVKDLILKYQENGNVLLNITEDLTFPDLIQKYVNSENVNDSHGQYKSNVTNKPVSYKLHQDNPTSIINNMDKDLEKESQTQDRAINNELNVNNNIITMLDQIDPSQVKVSVVVLEDSDEDAKDDNSTNSRETTPGLNNLNLSNSERGNYLGEENNDIPYTPEKCNNLTEIAMKNIKKLRDNYNNNPINPGSDLFVSNNRIELNENINDNDKVLKDKEAEGQGLESRGESGLLEPCTRKCVIDEKLVNLSRIVITPIEHKPEWKKHSRNGVIKCKNFSVRNFTKPVIVTAKQLSKCTPYINTNKNDCRQIENDNYMKGGVRIKFEDDNFEMDFDFDDINNGIKYQKYIELYNMPDHLRKNRIKLTRKLKLSRTYFSLNFWSLDSNIELLTRCKPMAIKLNKGISRVAKRVELSDINEVRTINRSILTAQVSPTMETAAPIQRSCASQEAINSTNNSFSLDSDTTRKTNNSLNSAVHNTELQKLLTNYAIQAEIPKKSVIESITKDISNNNLMDSVLETMRLAHENNIQNSALQQSPVPTSDPTDVSATNTFYTIQKSTEEVRNDTKFNSIRNPLPDATHSKSQISSNHTKHLYIKHLQKVNNINNKSIKPDDTKMPDVADLRDMILQLVKHVDIKMGREYCMKLNRSSLKLHLKSLEKQQRVLVQKISKLTQILPQYDINMKSKKKKKRKKRKKINRIRRKQSKAVSICILPRSDANNITNGAVHTNTVFVDDDCEPNLVIDETNLKPSENMDLNNSQKNTNKNIQEICNIRKNETKKQKTIKKTKKTFKQPKKISQAEKPTLNEYQEWHRQKTMALKYFTLPTSDSSKLTSKDKIAKQKRNTSIKQQNSGCQTNISIKRKNTQDFTKGSDTAKRSKMSSNETNVINISDTSSDDEVQITDRYIANTNKLSNTTDASGQAIDNIVKMSFLKEAQAANQNVCVIKTPATDGSQPVYVIINDTQTAAPDAINKTPIALQVVLNETQQTQVVMNEQCQLTSQCKCLKCRNTPTDDSSATLDVIQNMTSGDSTNNEPSTCLPTQNDHLTKGAITVKEYLASNQKLTALIKVDRSQRLLFFCSKYIILTDVNIPSVNATYRATTKIKNNKELCRVLVPAESKGSVLVLGLKNESDYIHCKCLNGTTVKCKLCQRINIISPNSTAMLKIGQDYYKSIGKNKYVCLTYKELITNSRSVLEGHPDLILVNKMFFKKLTDSPPTYVRILSAPPDAATLRHLVRREVVLYALDITRTEPSYTPLEYVQTDGQVTVNHTDDKLVKILQWILN